MLLSQIDDAKCTALLTAPDPNGELAFGRCDRGKSEPELGYVSLVEYSSVRGQLGLPIERRHFESDKTVCAYAD